MSAGGAWVEPAGHLDPSTSDCGGVALPVTAAAAVLGGVFLVAGTWAADEGFRQEAPWAAAGNDRNDTALILWNNGDIFARRLLAGGSGSRPLIWDGRVPGGVCFYELEAGGVRPAGKGGRLSSG